ncbi:hypothetical protein KH388_22155 [Serratia rubidaea]|nr:hypothetical protein [Serratia rubidaea]
MLKMAHGHLKSMSRNIKKAGREDGSMLEGFVSNNAALKINSDYVHYYTGTGTTPGLYVLPSVFDIPVLRAGSTSKNIVVTTKIGVKGSC